MEYKARYSAVCTGVISNEVPFNIVNLNPSAPPITGLPKIHNINSPFRKIINWQDAPAYKLAKLLSKLLQYYVLLPNAFNVKTQYF